MFDVSVMREMPFTCCSELSTRFHSLSRHLMLFTLAKHSTCIDFYFCIYFSTDCISLVVWPFSPFHKMERNTFVSTLYRIFLLFYFLIGYLFTYLICGIIFQIFEYIFSSKSSLQQQANVKTIAHCVRNFRPKFSYVEK